MCYKIILSYQAFLLPRCLSVVARTQNKLHNVSSELYDANLSPFSALMVRNRNNVRYYIASVSSAFAKELRKATLRFVVPVCSLSCPSGTRWLTMDGFLPSIYGFLLKSAYQVQFTFENHTDIVHEDVHKYMILPYRIIFRLIKSFNGSCTEKSKRISYPMHFLLKIFPFSG
jgi:hypothetical protein